MLRRIVLSGVFVSLATYTVADISSDSLELYYKRRYQDVVVSIENKRDVESRLFLAKTYVALNENEKANAVVSRVRLDSKHSAELARYADYLKVITSKDLANRASHLKDQEKHWLLWPKAFRNRAKWLIASECLRQKKAVQAEALFLSLRQDNYAPKDVAEGLVNVAILQKNFSKAMMYYQSLLSQFPDMDSDRNLYGAIAQLKKDTSAFGWDIVFSNSASLYPVMQKAFEKRQFGLSIEIGQVLLEKFGMNNYEFLYLLAQANFEKKQYDKSLDLLRFFESEKSLDSIQAKSVFLRAQCLQKKMDYEGAIAEYRRFFQLYPNSQLVPEVYFNLYWIYRTLNRSKEFLPDFERMKKAYSQSPFFDKLCWELGWEAYVADRRDEALQYFQIIPGNLDDEFKAKVLYWSAKACERSDANLAEKLRQFCVSKYAFTYYGTRLLLNSPAPVVAHYVNQVQSSNIPKDKFYLMLFEEGLGEWASQLLEDDLDSKNPESRLEKSYTLATLYQKMYQPNKAIRVLRKVGIVFSPQDKPFSRELAEMLYPRAYWDIVQAESKKYGLDPYFVLSVMRQESEFNPEARSKSGATGLMQLMPSTAQGIAKTLKVEWTGPSMMEDPEMNIRFGVYYLSLMHERFNGNWVYVLSGYNAGPNITRKWVDDSAMQRQDLEEFVVNIPYSETHYYVMKILKNYWVYKMLYEKGDQSRYAQAASH